jgi:protein-disulfide isomerase
MMTVDVHTPPEQAGPTSARPRGSSPLPVIVAIVVGLLGIALAVYAGGRTDGEPVTTDAPAAVEAADDRGTPYLGAADAPVVLTEYSDYRCPFCQRHALQVKPRIVAAYVDTGLVRYEWRDLPFQGEESVAAALAARAAQEQGRFWDYNRGLFERQDEGFSLDNLLALADDLGLDTSQFEDDLRSGRHQPLLMADVEAGRSAGFGGTPSFVINEAVITGAQPYAAFAEVIDAALAQAGR